MTLTPFDEFPIHQVPKPIALSASTDRNSYGRYWFGATHRGGEFQIEIAFGRYNNLQVQDTSVSISKNGSQHAFHASRCASTDPTELTIGPAKLEIIEPFRQLRYSVGRMKRESLAICVGVRVSGHCSKITR